jgi:hypothetical protein
MILFALIILIQVTGPDTQVIDINPSQVVTVRPPRVSDHFGPGVHCLINTTDGKFVGVVQTCETVQKLLQQNGGH